MLLFFKIAATLYLNFVCGFPTANELPKEEILAKKSSNGEQNQSFGEIRTNIPSLKFSFNAEEISVLNSLSKRKEELQEYEARLQNKALVLKTIEQNLVNKIRKLEQIAQKIEKASAALNEREDEKLKSLVKIYENMNAKRAAQIFDEIELETLMQIVCSMKEIKVSAILANMEIKKAKELSVALTKRKTTNE